MLDGVEVIVHHIIIFYHISAQFSILFYKRIDTIRDHMNHGGSHFPDGQSLGDFADVAHCNNLSDIAGLSADALGIRHHF